MGEQDRRAEKLQLLGEAARNSLRDVRWGMKGLVLNSIGGSPLMPRAGRVALLKAYGADVRSTGFFGGWRLEGRTDKLHIGSNCFFNVGVFIESSADVTIGDGTSIGMQAMILTSHHAIDDDGRWEPEASARPVDIGAGVWIGARAMILPGVTIGEGCVIAAGSVVAKDCAPWTLYGGVPARPIRTLRASSGTAS